MKKLISFMIYILSLLTLYGKSSTKWPSLGRNDSERILYPIDIQNLVKNYATAAFNLAVKMTGSEIPTGELIQGRFELRANGERVHLINEREISKHHY